MIYIYTTISILIFLVFISDVFCYADNTIIELLGDILFRLIFSFCWGVWVPICCIIGIRQKSDESCSHLSTSPPHPWSYGGIISPNREEYNIVKCEVYELLSVIYEEDANEVFIHARIKYLYRDGELATSTAAMFPRYMYMRYILASLHELIEVGEIDVVSIDDASIRQLNTTMRLSASYKMNKWKAGPGSSKLQNW